MQSWLPTPVSTSVSPLRHTQLPNSILAPNTLICRLRLQYKPCRGDQGKSHAPAFALEASRENAALNCPWQSIQAVAGMQAIAGIPDRQAAEARRRLLSHRSGPTVGLPPSKKFGDPTVAVQIDCLNKALASRFRRAGAHSPPDCASKSTTRPPPLSVDPRA